MKHATLLAGTALASLLMGCASQHVVLAPVGPNPTAGINSTALGQLIVYSPEAPNDDGNAFAFAPEWYQRMDYNIYYPDGKLAEHVINSPAPYDANPATITLAPGDYVVKSPSREYMELKVPITVEAGKTTRVHLDARWKASEAPPTEVVSTPGGYPVGWRSE
jgi:hypothetical protein